MRAKNEKITKTWRSTMVENVPISALGQNSRNKK
jgi:hypothetical protein